MVGSLLLRGMIVGLVAALFAFGVARVHGEPQVELAIGFEQANEGGAAHSHDHAATDSGSGAVTDMGADGAMPMTADGTMDLGADGTMHMTTHDAALPQIFSRATQSGLGLFTGVMVYGAAFGGLFALVFAFAWGRMGALGPRGTAAVLAVLGFTAVILVPGLKYPSSPPAVGNPDTIVLRTQLYFAMIVLSVVAMVLAVWAARLWSARFGAWNAAVLAGAGFVLAMSLVALVLPAINDVPPGFPASLLWQFRIAAFGIQAALWAVTGLAFGYAAEGVLMRRTGALNRDTRAA